jgi:hypothetical protein
MFHEAEQNILQVFNIDVLLWWGLLPLESWCCRGCQVQHGCRECTAATIDSCLAVAVAIGTTIAGPARRLWEIAL